MESTSSREQALDFLQGIESRHNDVLEELQGLSSRIEQVLDAYQLSRKNSQVSDANRTEPRAEDAQGDVRSQ